MRSARILLLALCLATSGAACLGTTQAGYPLALDVPGPLGVLARIAPEDLTRASSEDIETLSRALAQLDAAVYQAEARKDLLAAKSIERLRAEDREAIREVWADMFEPLMAIESLKVETK